jgi:hypothetical protein
VVVNAQPLIFSAYHKLLFNAVDVIKLTELGIKLSVKLIYGLGIIVKAG